MVMLGDQKDVGHSKSFIIEFEKLNPLQTQMLLIQMLLKISQKNRNGEVHSINQHAAQPLSTDDFSQSSFMKQDITNFRAFCQNPIAPNSALGLATLTTF